MKHEQKLLEILSVGYLFFVLLTSAIVFHTTHESPALINFSDAIANLVHFDPAFYISNRFFEALSLLGITLVLVPLLFPQMGVIFKRSFYLLASYPLPIYTIPVGWYAARTRGTGIGVLVYLLFEFSFFIISRAVWRTERQSDATDSHHTTHFLFRSRLPHYRRSNPHIFVDRS